MIGFVLLTLGGVNAMIVISLKIMTNINLLSKAGSSAKWRKRLWTEVVLIAMIMKFNY